MSELPDVERLASSYLRSHAGVVALVGDRVYTAFPSQAGAEPLVLVQRIGGIPPLSHPLVIDEAQLQVDTYGGRKVDAWAVMARVLVAFDELEGQVRPEGSVSAVRQGAIRWQPDDTYTPGRPRYVADVTLTTRPALPAVELELADAGTRRELVEQSTR
jgi:Protein of unknown function (DUF3168)